MKKLAKLLAAIVFILFVLASPFGRILDRRVSNHLANLYTKFEKTKRLSFAERVECFVIYKSIAYAGYVVSPEGSAVVNHYINGSGNDLYLNNSYIKHSVVIKQNLSNMHIGETKRISLKQNQDWRLSYALNPMKIQKNKHSVVIFQKIVFSKNPKIYTQLNYGLGKIKIPDGLIHTLHPKPYTVYCKWKV